MQAQSVSEIILFTVNLPQMLNFTCMYRINASFGVEGGNTVEIKTRENATNYNEMNGRVRCPILKKEFIINASEGH